MGPLYRFGWFDFAYSLQMAGLIGFFFGFVLERAGFCDARKLTAIFYLKDFSVLKVMFTAIVVCLLGLLYFSVFGIHCKKDQRRSNKGTIHRSISTPMACLGRWYPFWICIPAGQRMYKRPSNDRSS